MSRLLLFYFLILYAFNSNAQKIGEWSDHLPYRNVVAVSNGNKKIYAGTMSSYFTYDKNDLYILRYSKANGLSDIGVSTLRYNKEKEVLLIAYSNANIDLVFKDKIFNIADIKQANIPGEKRINDIYFSNNYAYLSTSFGIVVIDLDRKEIKDTYKIGPGGTEIKINGATSDGENLYAATASGIFVASLTDGSNLLSFTSWNLQTDGIKAINVPAIVNFNGTITASINDSLFQYKNHTWQYFYSAPTWTPIFLNSDQENLIVTEIVKTQTEVPAKGRISKILPDGTVEYYLENAVAFPKQAVEDEAGNIYVADFYLGLIKYSNGTRETIETNGPFTASVFDMEVEDGILYVAPGGANSNFQFTFNQDGVFINQGFWFNYNKLNTPVLDQIFDIIVVEADPFSNKVYFGSLYGGLLEYENYTFKLFDKDNSPLTSPTGDPERTEIGGLAFDSQGNLWITNYGTSKPIVVKTTDEQWYSYSLPGGITGPTQIVVDDKDLKWMIMPIDNTGIAVFYENNTFDNKADDQVFIYNTATGGLPTNEVTVLAADKDGELWAGTTQGISIFSCGREQILEGSCKAYRPLLEQDGYTGYLLENEIITDIAVDGANRKWIGTLNGAFLMSEDGTKQIEYFHVDNSPLFSNTIIDIAIDPLSGIVYFGTDKGIISYKSTATEGGEKHENVLVYPNPVREDYTGPIAIKGLVTDANVKITDVSGNLIYQTTALGGQAIWDGKTLDGKRAHTGVYLVFSTNNDGTETIVAKLLFIN